MFCPLTFYKNLADDTRLKSLLLIASKQELCVCDLQQALELSQPKISRHLAQLRDNHILATERRGKWIYYRLHHDLPQWAKTVLTTTTEHNQAFIKDNLREINGVRHNRGQSQI